jgi:hypothetical protein
VGNNFELLFVLKYQMYLNYKRTSSRFGMKMKQNEATIGPQEQKGLQESGRKQHIGENALA